MEPIHSDNHDQKPRILLVENDPRAREAYEALLRHWDYIPVLAEGEGELLIADAIARARQEHCILALIDLRLLDDYDDGDISGLKLTRKIGPIRSIILSGNLNQEFLLDMLANHKDIPFMNKGASPGEKRRILDAEVRKSCATKRRMQISPLDLLAEINRTTFGSLIQENSDQVADLLAQLFPAAKNLRIERLDASNDVSHVTGVPRPSSVVLKVHEEDLEPVVVKLARAEKIEIEVARYEKFIFRRLPGSFVARLEKHALLWDIGGALYSYIGDFDVKIFSTYYEEHSIHDIEECLTSFFTVAWGKHYQKGRAKKNVSLFKLYEEVWGKWYEKLVKDFPSEPLWQATSTPNLLHLPNPIHWFRENIAEAATNDLSMVEKTRKTITHGDLHGDNLLIDSRKNAWVIDFERSGEGHALQDFIELESDIINRLQAHNEDTFCYYQMCILVAQQKSLKPLAEFELECRNNGILKALQTISTLRSLALRCTGIKDARQYLLGLLFNTIFRATINNVETNRERQIRALILAGIFCHRLDHWNESWPPEEWKSILQS